MTTENTMRAAEATAAAVESDGNLYFAFAIGIVILVTCYIGNKDEVALEATVATAVNQRNHFLAQVDYMECKRHITSPVAGPFGGYKNVDLILSHLEAGDMVFRRHGLDMIIDNHHLPLSELAALISNF